jgi:hypothetical protein
VDIKIAYLTRRARWASGASLEKRCRAADAFLARNATLSVVAVLMAVSLALTACQADGKFEGVPGSVCASGKIWTYEDKDSPLMNPGRSCIGCHVEYNDPAQAPFYTAAGTVMKAEHEGDDCAGVPELTVIITDADGTEWPMTGNSVGSFWLPPDSPVVLPYTARIVDKAGNERVQQVPVSDGDCASCHTQDGANGAAGRLVPPEVAAP